MKIGIFFIGTDRYFELYENFKQSILKYFLPKHEKYFFITTDNENYKPKENEYVNYTKHTNWKLINLNRFKFFLNFDVSNMDYVFFFNANSLCLETINDEDILPTKNDGYLSSSWMNYSILKVKPTPWCENKFSSCYVENYNKEYACRGNFQGGKTNEFIKCCIKCVEMINEDSKINFIPNYNDEPYFNKYAYDNNVKKIDESIISYNINMKPKIILNNKAKLFGIDYVKKIKGDYVEIKTSE